MAYYRTLKSGERRLIYTAKDKHIQAQRRQLNGFHFRKPFSFNIKTVNENVKLCIISVYPYTIKVNEWMDALLESQEGLRVKIQNTLRWQANGKFVEPVWHSGSPNGARALLADVQEEIRMVRAIGKELGVKFDDRPNNSQRGS